jgi:hypothetical protein
MPKRSRSHQLETESIRRFEETLPSHWVCRRKDNDYGVDLEIEIFDTDGDATGLICYVQIKATDNVNKSASLSIEYDRLVYLSNLDSPSILVRYNSVTNKFYWKWLSNALFEIGPVSSRTATLRFHEGEIWPAAELDTVVETLKVYRSIRNSSKRMPIGVFVDSSHENRHRYNINAAVADISASCRFVRAGCDVSECLPVHVGINSEHLTARVDVIASLSMQLDAPNRNKITSELAYMLAFIASGYEFVVQTRDLVEFIRERAYRCQSRTIAATLAARVAEHPTLAADIAQLNGIHERQDDAYLIYIHGLLREALPSEEKMASIARFYADALDHHSDGAPGHQASIHYSFGNALRNSGSMLAAVRQYNLARRKHRNYLDRPYFLAEFAAALFLSRKFRISSVLYESALLLEPSPRFAICAGDANMFSGSFRRVRECFNLAEESDDLFEANEAALKCWLAGWIEQYCEAVPLRGELGSAAYWFTVLEKSINSNEVGNALGACLALCYLVRDNELHWVQAIALSVDDGRRELIHAVIAGAVWSHGHAAYSEFRDHFSEHEDFANVLEALDRVVLDLIAQRNAISQTAVTTRIFDDNHYDTVLETN